MKHVCPYCYSITTFIETTQILEWTNWLYFLAVSSLHYEKLNCNCSSQKLSIVTNKRLSEYINIVKRGDTDHIILLQPTNSALYTIWGTKDDNEFILCQCWGGPLARRPCPLIGCSLHLVTLSSGQRKSREQQVLGIVCCCRIWSSW